MKIAIPTNGKKGFDEVVAMHFGRCNTYTFLDDNGSFLECIENSSEHMGGTGLPPELLKEHNVNVLLCKELGPRALELCNKNKIEVYTCNASTVKGIFELWKKSKLKKAGFEDVCEEHKL